MSPIPSSRLSGHDNLHRRALAALGRCQETQSVDFNRSAPWEELQIGIVKTSMAMGNLRDGGIIIVGVSENGTSWELAGISCEHLATFDPDVMIGKVNRYASPDVNLDIVIVEHDNKTFLTIYAHEFIEKPFVCKANGPEKPGGGLHFAAGDFLIRPTGIPRTERIRSAEQMHDLLEVAAEKLNRRMMAYAHRVGLVTPPAAETLFEQEREGL